MGGILFGGTPKNGGISLKIQNGVLSKMDTPYIYIYIIFDTPHAKHTQAGTHELHAVQQAHDWSFDWSVTLASCDP